MEIVAGIMAGIGALTSILGGVSGSKAAKKAGKEEARLETIVSQAKIEDLRKEEAALRGQTIAGAAGAGVKAGVGSPLTIIAEQMREFARERRTVAQVGATRAAQAVTRGRMVGRQATYAGLSTAASQASSAFSIFAKARG